MSWELVKGCQAQRWLARARTSHVLLNPTPLSWCKFWNTVRSVGSSRHPLIGKIITSSFSIHIGKCTVNWCHVPYHSMWPCGQEREKGWASNQHQDLLAEWNVIRRFCDGFRVGGKNKYFKAFLELVHISVDSPYSCRGSVLYNNPVNVKGLLYL